MKRMREYDKTRNGRSTPPVSFQIKEDFYSEEDEYSPIAPAVSNAEPTAEQMEETKLLNDVFRDVLTEDSVYSVKRKMVLHHLQILATEWLKVVIEHDDRSVDELSKIHCKVLPFGSCHLDVCSSASDIDALLVCSKIASRSLFFKLMPQVLGKHSFVKNIVVLRDAFVPIIQFALHEVQVDLTFARLGVLDLGREGELDLSSDSIFKDCDLKSVICLNGRRVSEKLVRLVPHIDNFRNLLKIVKHWAKNRGIYSNLVGYLGGVNWAILAARICQMYPSLTLAPLVKRFFMVWAQWEWPNPVLLCRMRPSSVFQSSSNQGLFKMQWDPFGGFRYYERMPIITPAFPCMNSSHNVNDSTLRTLKYEFSRAFGLVNQNASDAKTCWEAILNDRIRIHRELSRYLLLSLTTMAAINLSKWKLMVFHRLKSLMAQLDNVDYVWPRIYPQFIPSRNSPNVKAYILIGLDVDIMKNRAKKARTATSTKGTVKTVELTEAVHYFAALLDPSAVPDADISCDVVEIKSDVDRETFFKDLAFDA